jgi:outer membrane protein OmpA-like peptidoglycan-associated protein
MVRSGRFCAFVLALMALPAAAQNTVLETPSFPVERFRPSLSRDGMLDVEWAGVGKSFEWDVGLWGNYALNPLVLYADGRRETALVAHRVGLNLTGALSLFDWVQVGFDLPVVAFQTRNTSDVAGLLRGVRDLNTVAVGDLRLTPKVRILRSEDQLVDLAIIPLSIGIPTGAPVGSYQGEEQFTLTPELLFSVPFSFGLRAAANLGYKWRPSAKPVLNLLVDDELLYRVGLGYRFQGVPAEIDATLSGAVSTVALDDLAETPLEVLVGGQYDVLPFLQVNAAVGGGILPGFGTPDFRVVAGIRLFSPNDNDKDDDGIADGDDGCPEQAEDLDAFDDIDGCPDEDNDGDGILDAADAAPDVAEDKDGFEDDNGAPEPDNDNDDVLDADDRCRDTAGPVDNRGCPYEDTDRDGILDKDDDCRDQPGLVERKGCPAPPDGDKDGVIDADDKCPAVPGLPVFSGCPDTDGDGFSDNVDKCPTEAEIVNNVEDDDGCPDKGKTLVNLTKEKIEILEKIYFDTAKSTIKTVSFPLLDQVATVLKSHPELTKVRVEGHTDDVGDDAKNQTLSNDRAIAVRDYLVRKGVPVERLDAQGFGETKPVADNKKAAGRDQNRRVEFVVVTNP